MIGAYSESVLFDMSGGMELVIEDIPTDRQFYALRRYCGNYAQATKAAFVYRACCGGEVRAVEAHWEKACKVAGYAR